MKAKAVWLNLKEFYRRKINSVGGNMFPQDLYKECNKHQLSGQRTLKQQNTKTFIFTVCSFAYFYNNISTKTKQKMFFFNGCKRFTKLLEGNFFYFLPLVTKLGNMQEIIDNFGDKLVLSGPLLQDLQ